MAACCALTTIELDETGRPRFIDPRGRVVAVVPAPPTTAELGWPTILRANAALAITSETNTPMWDGDRVDYGAVIDALVSIDDSAESARRVGACPA